MPGDIGGVCPVSLCDEKRGGQVPDLCQVTSVEFVCLLSLSDEGRWCGHVRVMPGDIGGVVCLVFLCDEGGLGQVGWTGVRLMPGDISAACRPCASSWPGGQTCTS